MVFRGDDGRAIPTRVRIGHENGLEAEVLEGLDAGQGVVTHPSDRVAPRARIEPREVR
jgi:HlyD family secretion protein